MPGEVLGHYFGRGKEAIRISQSRFDEVGKPGCIAVGESRAATTDRLLETASPGTDHREGTTRMR
jgi:hypothetical protein